MFIAGKDGVTGTGKIRVRGSNGMSGYPSSSGQPMGGGGGGSGGSIWLRSTGDMAVATLEVRWVMGTAGNRGKGWRERGGEREREGLCVGEERG